MIVIQLGGHIFELNYDRRTWETSSTDRAAIADAEVLTDAMDPSGPGGEEPDVGAWALREVRRVWPDIKVVHIETPQREPGLVY